MTDEPKWEEMVPGAAYMAQVGPLSIVITLNEKTGWWMMLGGVIRETLNAQTLEDAKREGILTALEELQAAQKMLYQLIYAREG